MICCLISQGQIFESVCHASQALPFDYRWSLPCHSWLITLQHSNLYTPGTHSHASKASPQVLIFRVYGATEEGDAWEEGCLYTVTSLNPRRNPRQALPPPPHSSTVR